MKENGMGVSFNTWLPIKIRKGILGNCEIFLEWPDVLGVRGDREQSVLAYGAQGFG